MADTSYSPVEFNRWRRKYVNGAYVGIVDENDNLVDFNGAGGGTGDVSGPASTTGGKVAVFADSSGNLLREGVENTDLPSVASVTAATAAAAAANAAAANALAVGLPRTGGVISGPITYGSAPVLDTELVNKAFVTSVAAGIVTRARARAATTGNITIATALNNGDTLDGVSLVTSDLVLVKNQTAPAENGIYVVGVTPARSTEFDTFNEHPGSQVAVVEGTQGGTVWLCTSNLGGTLGVTAITFDPSGTAGALVATSNLSDVADPVVSRNNIGALAAANGTASGLTVTSGSMSAIVIPIADMDIAPTNTINTSLGDAFKRTIASSLTLTLSPDLPIGRFIVVELIHSGVSNWTVTLSAAQAVFSETLRANITSFTLAVGQTRRIGLSRTANRLSIDREQDAPTTGVGAGSITNTELANIATATAKARLTSGTGPVEDVPIASFPINTATQTALNAKAAAVDPDFVTGATTGPLVPTQTAGNSTTRAASTAFATAASIAPPSIVPEPTTARTLSATDNGKVIRCTNAGATVVTVTAAFTGLSCTIVNAGGGTVTVATSGTTINGSLIVAGGATLLPTGTANTWDLIGATGDFEEDVQDIVGAMVVDAGGTYDGSGVITFPGGGGGSTFDAFETIPSAATTDLSTLTSLNVFITGSTGITSFGTAAQGTKKFIVHSSGALSITYNATSMQIAGGFTLNVVVGDSYEATSLGSGNWVIDKISRADGEPPNGFISSTQTIASSAPDLATKKGKWIGITGTTTITSFGTGSDGLTKFINFTGALTLTYNATTMILPGSANITTAAGDSCIALCSGSGIWKVAHYTRANGQPLIVDAELLAIAGLTSAADRLPYFTGSGTASLATFTAAGRALVDDADATAQRVTMGVVIGTDVQAYDADLAAIAGLTSAANALPYFTGAGTAAVTTLSSTARTLLDDASTLAMAQTLGVPKVLSKLNADVVPSVTPGTTENTAATVTITAGQLAQYSYLNIRMTVEKLNGTADTLTIQIKMNGVAFYSNTIATTGRAISWDRPFKVETLTTMRAQGHGTMISPFGGSNTSNRAAAFAINDVSAASNVFTVTLTMTAGTTEYGALAQFDVVAY